MQLLRILFLAAAPALFWLWIYYRRDRWEKEPKALVLRLFGLGAVAALPCYLIEGLLPGRGIFFDNFIRVGLTEELGKFAVIWFFVYHHKEFNEPMDGIVYGAAAALGFAAVENVFYAVSLGEHLLLPRAFTSTLAHVGFTGVLGYHLGIAKHHPARARRRILRGFVLAVALHGIYDALLTQMGLTARLTVLFGVPALLLTVFWLSHRACRASPFNPARSTSRERTPAAESKARGPA